MLNFSTKRGDTFNEVPFQIINILNAKAKEKTEDE